MKFLDRLVGSLFFGFLYTLMYSAPCFVLVAVWGGPEDPFGIVLLLTGFAGFFLVGHNKPRPAGSLQREPQGVYIFDSSSPAVIHRQPDPFEMLMDLITAFKPDSVAVS